MIKSVIIGDIVDSSKMTSEHMEIVLKHQTTECVLIGTLSSFAVAIFVALGVCSLV